MPAGAYSFKLSPCFHNLGEVPIRRPNRAPPAATKDGPRTNDEIRNAQIQLIDQNGTNHGTVETVVAVKMALEAGMDLVEISPNNNPPVCKIMDYGKYVFQQKKKQGEAKKKQKVIVVKEVQFRPRIDEHDFDFKKNNIIRFLQHGDKVKASIRFRGREMTHMELGRAVLDRLLLEIKEYGAGENAHPDIQGNRMTMVISPVK